MKFELALFIPPILDTLFKKVFPPKQNNGGWSGDYRSWNDARNNSTGYESEIILEKCKYASLKVRNGEAVYERDSMLFDKIQYCWGLLAGLQNVAIQNNGELKVLDFGGSLGTTYYQNKSFLPSLKKMEWSIVEQPHFVNCGKEFFEDECLKFYYSFEDSCLASKPNVLLLSGVLQYLEYPNQWIEKFNNSGVEYIIIDRTAFVNSKKDLLTIQVVPDKIYKASYPAWFFNQEKLIKKFKNYNCIANISDNITEDTVINNRNVKWEGMILKINK